MLKRSPPDSLFYDNALQTNRIPSQQLLFPYSNLLSYSNRRYQTPETGVSIQFIQ